jgi:hypothetical protein
VRGLEDDDVAAVRIAEVEADAIDEHALADIERRLHRLAGDAERLDQEGLDQQRKAESDGHDRDQLDQRVLGGFLGRSGGYAVSH